MPHRHLSVLALAVISFKLPVYRIWHKHLCIIYWKFPPFWCRCSKNHLCLADSLAAESGYPGASAHSVHQVSFGIFQWHSFHSVAFMSIAVSYVPTPLRATVAGKGMCGGKRKGGKEGRSPQYSFLKVGTHEPPGHSTIQNNWIVDSRLVFEVVYFGTWTWACRSSACDIHPFWVSFTHFWYTAYLF